MDDNDKVTINFKCQMTVKEALELGEYLQSIWKSKAEKKRPGRPRKEKA